MHSFFSLISPFAVPTRKRVKLSKTVMLSRLIIKTEARTCCFLFVEPEIYRYSALGKLNFIKETFTFTEVV